LTFGPWVWLATAVVGICFVWFAFNSEKPTHAFGFFWTSVLLGVAFLGIVIWDVSRLKNKPPLIGEVIESDTGGEL